MTRLAVTVQGHMTTGGRLSWLPIHGFNLELLFAQR
jgi:hypothetical protein